MTSRCRVAQRKPAPGRNLSAFPRRRLTKGRLLWRFARRRNPEAPWWFASVPADLEADSGRFDLPAPQGTCYLALDQLTCILELIGPEWFTGGVVSDAFITIRRLYAYELPAGVTLANLTGAGLADFRVSSELASMADYAVPQAWAQALANVRTTTPCSPCSPRAC